MSKATLNRVTQIVAERPREAKLPLEPFTVHDLRRTGSTILNELGFNSDWIEVPGPRDGRSSRGVYNKAEYAEQRRHAAGVGRHDRCLVAGKTHADAAAADDEGGDDGAHGSRARLSSLRERRSLTCSGPLSRADPRPASSSRGRVKTPSR